MGITQLFKPFLTYFPVWLVFAFLTGGIEGATVANTNFKISRDFMQRGESEEVRSFAMGYGGAFSIMIQVLAEKLLVKRE